MPANQTPVLCCPRCKLRFRFSLDKLTKLLKCRNCKCHFRVTRDRAGGYALREEGAPPSASAPKGAPPRAGAGANRPPLPPTTAHPLGAALPGVNPDRTILGQSAASPLAPPVRPGGRAADADVAAILAAPTITAKCSSHAGAEGDAVRGRVVPPPPPRHPAPPPAPRASAAPPPPPPRRGAGGGWKWVVALLAVLALIAGGTAAAFYLLPLGKAAPVSLGKYGGVEIGSTGVKMVGVEYLKTGEGVVEQLLDEPTDANPKLADLPVGADDFDARALERTVAQVGDYVDVLRKLGVPPENLYIACSSGVKSPFKTDESWQRNHERLAQALRDKTGKDAAFIDEHLEAQCAFQELVPAKEWTNSVLIDIGGNNIKGGGYIRKDVFLDFKANAGVSRFEKTVTKGRAKDESFVDAARRLREAEVKQPLEKDLAAVSELTKRPKLYFIGGLPWALATYTRPVEFYAPSKEGTKESYLRKLQAADIPAFDELVRNKKPADIKSDVKVQVAGKDKDLESAANENVDKIQTEVFKNPDRLVGGAQIMLVLDQEFAVSAANKEVWSFRYGQVAWLLGYLKSKSGHAD